MKDESSTMRKLIKLAKERLLKNNYSQLVKEEAKNRTKGLAAFLEQNHKNQIKTVNAVKTSSNNKVVTKENPMDEKMYKIVSEMLSSGKVYLNPVLELIDRSIFDKLDSEAKQFYLNRLSEKYIVLRSRFYKEHPQYLYIKTDYNQNLKR